MSGLLAGDIIFDPIVSLPAIALLAALSFAFTVYSFWKVGWSLGTARNLTLMLLRLAAIALVLALLLQPSHRTFLPPITREYVTLIGVDTSLSMKQRDAGNKTRLDEAKNLLSESGVLDPNGRPSDPRLRIFCFSEDATPLQQSLLEVVPTGKTTRFHKSISTILSAPEQEEMIKALILITDGHDFELVNPIKTGTLAHNRKVPIYAVATGKQGKVRDVAVRITGYQPYCYVKQKARVNANLRLVGCQLEDLTVQLLRQGKVVQTKQVNAQQLQDLPVQFEVTEPEIGQYEYEVTVQPLENEVETANNSAITYLNVIDQQVRVLLVEGDPYWDTTFLQRSLMRNDKFDLDALIRYGPKRVRAIRKTPVSGELRPPQTLDELAAYDVVILGRQVNAVLSAPESGSPGQKSLLDQFVNERGGTVVFSRGHAFSDASASDLEPVLWGDKARERVHLDLTREGRGLSAFRALSEEGGLDRLPDLVRGNNPGETRPLTSTLAVAASREDATLEAAIVHRRYGSGQVVSIGVDGLWRWALNSKVEPVNSAFDHFWDQMILWLLAGRDFIPNRQFSFQPSSANILLGERVYFRLLLRQPDPKVKSVPVTIYFGDKEVGRVNLIPVPGSATRMTAEFLPERTGRYRATVKLPDGATQESRFIVFTENLEETEVTTDTLYLRRLCESSGGRLIAAAELSKLLKEVSDPQSDLENKTILQPAWNSGWVFYLAGLLFGLEWFLRRRWGLA